MKALLTILFIALPFAANAELNTLSAKNEKLIKKLADEYLTQKAVKQLKQVQIADSSCTSTSPVECTKYICGTSFNCTYDGMVTAAKACHGNDDATCVKYICGTSFNCTYDGMIQAAKACGGN